MKKVLIVEDDPMLVEIYKRKFSENINFKVITATSGTETEKKVAQEKPDLILLDLILPEEDGFQVLEKVRKTEAGKDIKIIVFSNLSQEEEKEKAMKLGADDFMVKSDFTPQQIMDKIKEFFGEEEDEPKAEKKKDGGEKENEAEAKENEAEAKERK
jgi:DNA-binding response OmpR family regulator